MGSGINNNVMDPAGRKEKGKKKNRFHSRYKVIQECSLFLTGTRSCGAGPGKPVNGRQYFGIPSD